MAAATLTITIHVAWWLRWYIHGVAMTCMLTGTDPDMDKVERMIERALSFHTNPVNPTPKGPAMKQTARKFLAIAIVAAITAIATYAAYASCCRPVRIPALF